MTKIAPELQNRTEDENKQTINCLLNLYDLMLQEYSELIQNIGQNDNAENNKDNAKNKNDNAKNKNDNAKNENNNAEKNKDNAEKNKDNDKKDKQEKSDILTEFKAFATLADTLMKRWNIAHRGYDTNARIAASDAKTGQQRGKAGPVEARKGVTIALHPDMKSAVEKLPKRETDEPDRSGTIPLLLNSVEPNDSKDSPEVG